MKYKYVSLKHPLTLMEELKAGEDGAKITWLEGLKKQVNFLLSKLHEWKTKCTVLQQLSVFHKRKPIEIENPVAEVKRYMIEMLVVLKCVVGKNKQIRM